MVHQVGKTIVGVDGKPFKLRGVNLGGWLLWEGGDFGKAILLSESTMLDRLGQLIGAPAAQDFRNQIYANYITAADFQRIAQLGFNSVRLPINAKILEDDDRPYVYKPSGWDLIDHAVTWGEKYSVYAVGSRQNAVNQKPSSSHATRFLFSQLPSAYRLLHSDFCFLPTDTARL